MCWQATRRKNGEGAKVTALSLKTPPQGDRWSFAGKLIKKTEGKSKLTKSAGLGGLLAWLVSAHNDCISGAYDARNIRRDRHISNKSIKIFQAGARGQSTNYLN